ncbi:MAG: pyridoxamine kinase [Clostridium sp.]|nr:pyridoxamine kinase [Clostridium sp.]MCM1548330.1 pyridoxamine kinase [Ruminococcus sp.]
MRIPRAACINDLSGFGRCSLTTAISIISAAGVQACPVPTAVLSKHTGFESFYFYDLTDSLTPYLDNWSDLDFDGIYSGFLGSPEQIDIVGQFILEQKKKNSGASVIIDPVMGDKGRLYATYTEEMYKRMKRLIAHADLITPNITEACFLTETQYTGEDISDGTARELCRKLADMGSMQVVLTGIVRYDNMINITYDGSGFNFDAIHRESQIFSGTGDIFASVVCAMILKGRSLTEAVTAAGEFISRAIEYTVNAGSPLKEGIVFEPVLHILNEF